jgi:UDP-GlcNAc:undecaprenyl-phosphate GlcNAc-1-phosphate transferase
MIKIIPVALFFLSFFASLVSNAWLRILAKKNSFLIDRPDKYRKFHKNPTPLTGGIGITFGIIFSGIFLFFLADTSYTSEVSADNFLGQEQKESYEIKINNEKGIVVERIDDESFSITLPDGRKSIYKISESGESMLISTSNNSKGLIISNFSFGLVLFTILLQFLMTFDDLRGLKAVTRLLIQSGCTGGLIFFSGVYIQSLGNLFGLGEIYLGFWGIPFTIFCVVGMINAFNMIDGLNGLCASLCLVCFTAIIYMINADTVPSLFPLILPVGAITGFLMYNLGVLGNQRTVFLGDNGSNALGFMCAWILVYFSSVENSNFAPVTALWFVAIPFFDAVGVMTSRVVKGIMPLRPGRDHLHHKLLDMGLSSNAIYVVLIFISASFAALGYIFNNNFPESHYISFYAFMAFWLCYYFLTRYVSKNV